MPKHKGTEAEREREREREKEHHEKKSKRRSGSTEERHSSPLAQEAKSSRLLSGLRVLSCLSVVLSRDVIGPFFIGVSGPSASFVKIIVSE